MQKTKKEIKKLVHVIHITTEPRRNVVETYTSAAVPFRNDFDLCLLILETFLAMPTHVINICAKFY